MPKKTHHIEKLFYRGQELREMFDIPERTYYEWLRTNQIPGHVKTPYGGNLFNKKTLDQAVKNLKFPAWHNARPNKKKRPDQKRSQNFWLPKRLQHL